MKEQKFIIDEVKKHLQASARKNKYQVIDAVEEMPTFEGFIPLTTSLQWKERNTP